MPQHQMPPATAAAFAAAKLGIADRLAAALAPAPTRPRARGGPRPGDAAHAGEAAAAGGATRTCAGVVEARDQDGRCCLHYSAGYGHNNCVDLLIAAVRGLLQPVISAHGRRGRAAAAGLRGRGGCHDQAAGPPRDGRVA
jgi:hypothetical protein